MPDRSAISEYPFSGDVNVTGGVGETYTLDPARAALVQIYVDHADGGTVALGGGSAVPIAGQEWITVWIAGFPGKRSSTFEVTPTTTCDVFDRVY